MKYIKYKISEYDSIPGPAIGDILSAYLILQNNDLALIYVAQYAWFQDTSLNCHMNFGSKLQQGFLQIASYDKDSGYYMKFSSYPYPITLTLSSSQERFIQSIISLYEQK